MLRSRRGVAAVVVVCGLSGVAAPLCFGGGEGEPAQPAVPTADWHRDPLCRMVFLTVLEGLYTDGVPTAAVDAVLGGDAKSGDRVKHCFVFRCKLCHAVFDAFRAYQRRPPFYGSDVDTFPAKAIDPGLLERLKSPHASTRVFAMGGLIRPWIEKRLRSPDLGQEDRQRILDGLVALARDGAELTGKLRMTDPDYRDWSFYGACQACESIDSAARALREGEARKE